MLAQNIPAALPFLCRKYTTHRVLFQHKKFLFMFVFNISTLITCVKALNDFLPESKTAIPRFYLTD